MNKKELDAALEEKFPQLTCRMPTESIYISFKDNDKSFIDVSVHNQQAHIQMIDVTQKREGQGTMLIQAMHFILKIYGFKILSGHITDIGLLKLLVKYFSKNKITFFEKAKGSNISFDDAIHMIDKPGFDVQIEI